MRILQVGESLFLCKGLPYNINCFLSNQIFPFSRLYKEILIFINIYLYGINVIQSETLTANLMPGTKTRGTWTEHIIIQRVSLIGP